MVENRLKLTIQIQINKNLQIAIYKKRKLLLDAYQPAVSKCSIYLDNFIQTYNILFFLISCVNENYQDFAFIIIILFYLKKNNHEYLIESA